MTRVRRIVLTRNRERCIPWQRRLEAAGIRVLVLPMIRHERIAIPPGIFDEPHDWILFTSPEGVRAFFESRPAAGLVGRMPRLGALGTGTAAELECRGLTDDLKADARTGAEMARVFVDRVPAPCRILMPGAADRSDEPMSILRDAGHQAETLALYRTLTVTRREVPRSPFQAGDLVFFTSPSAVRAFGTVYSRVILPCAAIGEITARAAREAGFEPAVAARPDLESLCAAAGFEGMGQPTEDPARIGTERVKEGRNDTRNRRSR